MSKPFNTAESTPRDGERADLSALLLQGEDAIEQVGRAHMSWGRGSADRWDLDQTTGIITWTFPDKIATAPAHILGSFAPTSRMAVGLANKSLLPHMSRASRSFCEWAQANGHPGLAQPQIMADEQLASTLAALPFRITGATGYYKGPGGNSSYVVITFGPVTMTSADGSETTFDINIGH